MVIPLLRYEDAFRAYRRNKPEELKAWAGSSVMKQVEDIDFALAAAEMGLGDG